MATGIPLDEALLQVRGLSKRYDSFAFRSIDIEVAPDTVVGLVGVNGAGKTTLFKALLGLISVEGGSIRLLGEEVSAHPERLKQVKEDIGVVFDTLAFPRECSVKNLDLLGRHSYRSWDSTTFHALLERFKLEPNKQVGDLSRGMGMKLSIAFALAHNPRLLLLDEATAGLDPLARDELLEILRAFMEQDGRGMLIASHITSDLESIADRIVCIDAGRIVFDLPKEAICDEAGIARCRTADVERILESGYPQDFPLYRLDQNLEIDLLVPDRFSFMQRFADIVCEPASIDAYVRFMLKGSKL